MTNKNSYVKKMQDYKKCMKILECANYIYLDQIKNFDFKMVSKYTRSKDLYDKVYYDFKLVDDLIKKDDILNAATILRCLYENIIYIIATSYDKTIQINIDTSPGALREVLEKNCEVIFTDFFESSDFNNIYKYLCKIVHPSSLKELVLYMSKTLKYKNSMVSNLKYIMIIIEYMYLDFLNKKIGKDENDFYLNLNKICTYVNFINIGNCFDNVNDTEKIVKKYLYNDGNSKYVIDTSNKIKETADLISDNSNDISTDANEIARLLDKEIANSKYKKTVDSILSGN